LSVFLLPPVSPLFPYTTLFRSNDRPLFVHCCHCRWCQRESGASFALNAMIESDRVETIAGDPEIVLTPSASGKGQKIARCPDCRDRKSTRLNSSHVKISYAVFC